MPREDEMVQAVPAGSLPLNTDEENLPPVPNFEQPAAPATDSKGEKILGKFKDHDELTKAYQDLETDHGRLGSEVGSLRKQTELQTKQTELLLNQLAALGQERAQNPPVRTESPDFDRQLAELTQAVDSGTIDYSQAIAETVKLTQGMMDNKIRQARTEESALSAKDNWLKNNPDFTDLQRSGALQPIRGENPMHDDFSAYHEYKRREVAANLDAEKMSAYEKGKMEAAKLTQGADSVARVSGKSGATVRTPTGNSKTMSDGEVNQGMLDVLRKQRAG